jgi:hypothetical protein
VKAAALVLALLTAPVDAADVVAATLRPETIRAWNAYIAATEARIDAEHASTRGFLATDFMPDRSELRDVIADGAIPVSKLTTTDSSGKAIPVPDGYIAHWRGAVFVPGTTLDSILGRLQHPELEPHQRDVVALRVLERQPDRLKLAIRMTRRNVVTVTYDTEHEAAYRRHDGARASSTSVSHKIVEIEHAATPRERALPEGEDRGFLWRMNSYWRYEQVPGGVIVELESVTLSRGIPFGLSLIAQPIANRIARESITRTLDHIRRTYAQREVPPPPTSPVASLPQ